MLPTPTSHAIGAMCYKFDAAKIRHFVLQKIAAMEEEYGFKVLFAVERSSHIWGTAHARSDNDIHCVVFYPPRSYYSVINFVAENARQSQNRKLNQRRHQKLRELKLTEANKFIRFLKIQYGPRWKPSNCPNSNDSDALDKTLDVEISYHELCKLFQTAHECNINLYEIVASPLTYYHAFASEQMMTAMRRLVCSAYDSALLAHNYYDLALKNYKALCHENTNRINRDSKKKVKSLFLVWRCILLSESLLMHANVEHVPLQLMHLIKSSQLLSDAQKRMMTDKLQNGITQAIYVVDDEYDVLSDRCQGAFDILCKKIEHTRAQVHVRSQSQIMHETEEIKMEMEKFVCGNIIEKFDTFVFRAKEMNILHQMLTRMDRLIEIVNNEIE